RRQDGFEMVPVVVEPVRLRIAGQEPFQDALHHFVPTTERPLQVPPGQLESVILFRVERPQDLPQGVMPLGKLKSGILFREQTWGAVRHGRSSAWADSPTGAAENRPHCRAPAN